MGARRSFNNLAMNFGPMGWIARFGPMLLFTNVSSVDQLSVPDADLLVGLNVLYQAWLIL